MKLTARFKKLNIWNKIGFAGAIASIVGLVLYLFSDASPQRQSVVRSESGPAISINELRDSTLFFGSRGELENARNQPEADFADEHVSEDFSAASVLAFQTVGETFGFAMQVKKVSPTTNVRTILASSSESFRDALQEHPEIVHLSIGFDDRHLWFDGDDIISTVQFRDMFIAAGAPRVLVLDGCGSFAIGKVLEDAGLDYLVVALPDAPAADIFFTYFYQQLAKGIKPSDAAIRAKAEVSSRGGNPHDFSCTTYRS